MWFLPVLFRNLRQGPATDPFPFGEASTPKTFRGRVRFDPQSCTGCQACAHVCAGGAIRFEEQPDGLEFTLWHNACVFCGLCVHYCLSKAIRQTDDWHLAHPQADKFAMVERATVAYRPCDGCGKPFLPASLRLMDLAFGGSSPEIARLRYLCPECRRNGAFNEKPRLPQASTT